MTYINTNESYKTSIARIYTSIDDRIVGSGFLVSNQYIITCAHVVADALNIDKTTQDKPLDLVKLDFPFPVGQNQKKLKAKVILWQPRSYSGYSYGQDIAVLELQKQLPQNYVFFQLSLIDTKNHPFSVLGFPQGRDEGVITEGKVSGTIGNGLVQIVVESQSQFYIEPGFSGAPVWDEELASFVGIVVSSELDGDGLPFAGVRGKVKVAYMIPVEMLVKTWDFLSRFVQDKPTNPSNTASSNKKPIPGLLLYLANRSLQEFELNKAIAIDKRDTSRLLVCIIHGDQLQGHSKFLERMQNDFLPYLLDLDNNKTKVKIKPIEYSSELKDLNELPNFLLMKIKKSLSIQKSASLEEINKSFHKSSPIIVHTDIITDDWQKQGFQILNKLLEFWEDWHNKNTINENVIICICIKYINIKLIWNFKFISSLFKQYRYQQINDKMRKYITELSNIKNIKKFNYLSVISLSELKDIGRADTQKWANLDCTKNFVGEKKIQQLQSNIDAMFDNWETQNSSNEIPMNILADKLIEILENI